MSNDGIGVEEVTTHFNRVLYMYEKKKMDWQRILDLSEVAKLLDRMLVKGADKISLRMLLAIILLIEREPLLT